MDGGRQMALQPLRDGQHFFAAVQLDYQGGGSEDLLGQTLAIEEILCAGEEQRRLSCRSGSISWLVSTRKNERLSG